MEMTQFLCSYCREPTEKSTREINRQLRAGRTDFFCSLSCAAKAANASKKCLEFEIPCEYCGKPFKTSTHNKAAKAFCSRECASAGSVTDYRRNRAKQSWAENMTGPSVIAVGLKSREAWKYARLRRLLNARGIRHVFEHPVGGHIFDLAFLDGMFLFEFDGPYHNNTAQRVTDWKKTEDAMALGWEVIRIQVGQGVAIDPEVLYKYV